MMVVTCLSGLFMACVYVPWIALSSYWAFTWLGLANLLGARSYGPEFAIIQHWCLNGCVRRRSRLFISLPT